MHDVLTEIGDEVVGSDGAWEFQIGEVHVACLTDARFDRMRLIAPVVETDELTDAHREACLEANFHTALDARYATSEGVLYAAFSGRAVISDVPVSSGLVVLAGLLVGVGTRMGNGCTSGHGVCGLARLSGRSLVGTISFMAFGFLTVFVVRHVLELS